MVTKNLEIFEISTDRKVIFATKETLRIEKLPEIIQIVGKYGNLVFTMFHNNKGKSGKYRNPKSEFELQILN